MRAGSLLSPRHGRHPAFPAVTVRTQGCQPCRASPAEGDRGPRGHRPLLPQPARPTRGRAVPCVHQRPGSPPGYGQRGQAPVAEAEAAPQRGPSFPPAVALQRREARASASPRTGTAPCRATRRERELRRPSRGSALGLRGGGRGCTGACRLNQPRTAQCRVQVCPPPAPD